MSHQSPLSQWIETVSSRLPKLQGFSYENVLLWREGIRSQPKGSPEGEKGPDALNRRSTVRR